MAMSSSSMIDNHNKYMKRIYLTTSTGRVLCSDFSNYKSSSISIIKSSDSEPCFEATDSVPMKKYSKIEIPHPVKCVYCGATLKSYKCEYCESEYPKYKIIE